ncbi:SDR family oxidoreductase [Hyphococcus sp.]|uniref:SDR family oxidoreductase n=1 Tax=Hyphococcus sp. TaxID=2038636 RepID=UPI0020860931|nr:MAG: short chain dehydrogenase [Marinicaulis sp.]
MPANETGAALVTGAGKRIGRALALTLADAGYHVAVHYNASSKDADDVVALIKAKGRKAVALRADLSQEAEVSTLIKQAGDALGPLNLLVNSASAFAHDDVASMTRESWDLHMEVNLRAPAKLSQDFAAQAKPGAQIVNIIDQRVLKLTPQFLSYTASKAALWVLTRTMAQGLGPSGIRVNAIGPGPTLKNPRQSDEDWRRQNEATILGHGADPKDICGALVYLLSARSVTGQMIAVDGGQHLAWKTPDVLVQE